MGRSSHPAACKRAGVWCESGQDADGEWAPEGGSEGDSAGRIQRISPPLRGEGIGRNIASLPVPYDEWRIVSSSWVAPRKFTFRPSWDERFFVS